MRNLVILRVFWRPEGRPRRARATWCNRKVPILEMKNAKVGKYFRGHLFSDIFLKKHFRGISWDFFQNFRGKSWNRQMLILPCFKRLNQLHFHENQEILDFLLFHMNSGFLSEFIENI